MWNNLLNTSEAARVLSGTWNFRSKQFISFAADRRHVISKTIFISIFPCAPLYQKIASLMRNLASRRTSTANDSLARNPRDQDGWTWCCGASFTGAMAGWKKLCRRVSQLLLAVSLTRYLLQQQCLNGLTTYMESVGSHWNKMFSVRLMGTVKVIANDSLGRMF